MADKTCLIISGCICLWIVIIISCVLFACSFSLIELNEYGIIFDNNTQTIEEEPHTSGRHFTGLGRKFELFPRNYQFIEFSSSKEAQGDSLSCWTSDGLTIWIDISFYVSLNKEKLRDLHFEYGENWYSAIVRIATTSIKDTSPQFKTDEFFQQRTEISQKFQEVLKERLETYTQKGIKLESFQLRQINFDELYESSIISKLIDEQQVKTLQIQQQISQGNKEIELINQSAVNQVSRIYAAAEAQGSKKIQLAIADSFKEKIISTVDAYKDLFDQLDTDLVAGGGTAFSDIQKLQFMYVNELGNLQKSKTKVYLGLNSPHIKSQITSVVSSSTTESE